MVSRYETTEIEEESDNHESEDDAIRRLWAAKAQECIKDIEDKELQGKVEIVFVNVLLADNIYQMRKVLEAEGDEIIKQLLKNSTKQIDELLEAVKKSRETIVD